MRDTIERLASDIQRIQKEIEALLRAGNFPDQYRQPERASADLQSAMKELGGACFSLQMVLALPAPTTLQFATGRGR